MSPTTSAPCGAEQNEGTTSPVKLLALFSSARTRVLPCLFFCIILEQQCGCAFEQIHTKEARLSHVVTDFSGSLRNVAALTPGSAVSFLASVGVLSLASPSSKLVA